MDLKPSKQKYHRVCFGKVNVCFSEDEEKGTWEKIMKKKKIKQAKDMAMKEMKGKEEGTNLYVKKGHKKKG